MAAVIITRDDFIAAAIEAALDKLPLCPFQCHRRPVLRHVSPSLAESDLGKPRRYGLPDELPPPRVSRVRRRLQIIFCAELVDLVRHQSLLKV